MRDEMVVRRHVRLRHSMLEKNRQANRAAALNSQGTGLVMASDTALPAYQRPRRKPDSRRGAYQPPSKHNDLRNVARNSRKNARGFTIFNGHQIQHESQLEQRVSMVLQADNTVADLFSQAVRQDYIDVNGTKTYTIFDFLAIKRDGSHVGVAVKPERYRKRMEAMFGQIAKTAEKVFIDRAVFYSDLDATREKFANARNVLWARGIADPDEVNHLMEFLVSQELIEFWDLYDENEIGHWGRKAAIWRLIDLGILVPEDDGARIDDFSRLTVNL